MTRIAIIADSHWDQDSRFAECERIHNWIARDMAERGVDLCLHAGDVFERKSTPKERLAVAAWLWSVAEHRPVVMVRGNHDAVGDLALMGKLQTRHPIIVEEAAGVHVVAGVAIGCLAWPRRSEILARAESHAGAEDAAGVALRNVIRGLGLEMAAHEGPRVLLAHAMVTGSVTSTGQPLTGCDMELGLTDLSLANAQLVALGHIHMGQAWETTDGAPVVYPGSPRRSNFGELEAKGYLIVEFDDEGPIRAGDVKVTRVETPATPMIHVTGAMADDECPETGADIRVLMLDEAPEGLAGAEVRFRYQVPADERERARILAAGWKSTFEFDGAVSVQVEEVVIPTTRARAPEVAAAIGLPEKLAALWENRGTTPAEDRARELVRKATSLETAA